MKKILTLAIMICASTMVFAQYSHVAVGPNGNKIEEGQYNANPGILAGDSKETIATKMAAVHKIGVWKYWFENGAVAAEEHYDSNGTGIGIWKTWHPNGQLSSEINKTNGAVVYYHPNGQKAEEGTLNGANERTGAWKGWYETGVLNYTGSYSAGNVKNGTWKFFDLAGNTSASETFANGVKTN